MIRILSVVAVCGLLAGPALGAGEPTYTIKIKKAAAGQTEHVDKMEQSTERLKIVDNNGNAVKEEDKKTGHHYVYQQTILEKKPGAMKATRLKRKYEKASVTQGGETTRLRYEGKNILIEKKGDHYVFLLEGDEQLTGEDAKQLDKEFNKKTDITEAELEKLVLPPGPVKVNESWKVDPAPLTKVLEGMELNLEKTTATAKLTRAYRKDRRQFGVIVLQLNLVPKGMNKDGMTFAFQPNSKITLHVTIDGCIDGSSTTASMSFTGDMAIEALLPSPDQPMFRLSASSKGKGVSKTVEQ
jgi:hypothetical protein